MIQKNFDDIAKVDIDFLIENKINEFKTLEYKQKLPGSTDSDKKEFLADISSFANASGGDVIYGIKEEIDTNGKRTGQPEEVVPLEGITADEAKLQIEHLILNGIEPRIPVHVKEIAGFGSDGNGFVILVRIPQSFASPHMIKFKNTSRFYCRNSAGKYQLDYQEIKSAFLATDSQAERIRSFLQNRLAKIRADETPIPLLKTHRLVLHLLPLNSFLNQKRFDLSDEHSLSASLAPVTVRYGNSQYNLDGFMTYLAEGQSRNCKSYCQIFFDGTIETVSIKILRTNEGSYPKGNDTAYIPINYFESSVVKAIENYIKVYKFLGINPPIIVTVALLGCKGALLNTNFDTELDMVPLDRDVASLPQVQIISLDEDVPTLMKPIFDAIWNAFGFPCSYNYTKNGTWNVRLR